MTKLLCIFVGALLILGAPRETEAEIVAFTDGRILKVEDAHLDGASIVIELAGGGTLLVPATRVERVVADEVDDEPEPVPEPGECSWRYDDQELPEGLPYRDTITAAARRADLHPWLLAAVVEIESAFDPLAVSRAGAAGLTQLMPATAADLRVSDVFDPPESLRGGAEYLRAMLDRFGSLTLALAAYNAGPTTVERFGGVPPYRETRRYVRRILGLFCGTSPS